MSFFDLGVSTNTNLINRFRINKFQDFVARLGEKRRHNGSYGEAFQRHIAAKDGIYIRNAFVNLVLFASEGGIALHYNFL